MFVPPFPITETSEQLNQSKNEYTNKSISKQKIEKTRQKKKKKYLSAVKLVGSRKRDWKRKSSSCSNGGHGRKRIGWKTGSKAGPGERGKRKKRRVLAREINYWIRGRYFARSRLPLWGCHVD